eukprot:1429220-Rhodomonas_salina.2
MARCAYLVCSQTCLISCSVSVTRAIISSGLHGPLHPSEVSRLAQTGDTNMPIFFITAESDYRTHGARRRWRVTAQQPCTRRRLPHATRAARMS